MTKAEQFAAVFVDSMWRDVAEGPYRGSRFDVRTFDIATFVDVNLFTAYSSGTVPPVARRKALRLARRLWDRKVRGRQVNP